MLPQGMLPYECFRIGKTGNRIRRYERITYDERKSHQVWHIRMARTDCRRLYVCERATGSDSDRGAREQQDEESDDSGRVRHAILFGGVFAVGGGDFAEAWRANFALPRRLRPTPAVAYEIQRSKLDGAINFTASHNPAQYHGLKFSSADAGPALPEVTKDIEARVARIIAKDGAYPTLPAVPSGGVKTEKVNLRENYLKRLGELVRFETLRKANVSFVTDALHGCGAGYLDKALADHGRFRAGDAYEPRLLV